MMLYNSLKALHILSAAILFGTGMGTALYMLMANIKKEVPMIAKATAQVVRADGFFTGISGILQPITGLSMVYLKGYPLHHFWVWGSILGYSIAGLCCFPVVYLQIKCRQLAFAAIHQKTPCLSFIIVILLCGVY